MKELSSNIQYLKDIIKDAIEWNTDDAANIVLTNTLNTVNNIETDILGLSDEILTKWEPYLSSKFFALEKFLSVNFPHNTKSDNVLHFQNNLLEYEKIIRQFKISNNLPVFSLSFNYLYKPYNIKLANITYSDGIGIISFDLDLIFASASKYKLTYRFDGPDGFCKIIEPHTLEITPNYRNLTYTINVYAIDYYTKYESDPFVIEIHEPNYEPIYPLIPNKLIMLGNNIFEENLNTFFDLEDSNVIYIISSEFNNASSNSNVLTIEPDYRNTSYDVIVSPSNVIYPQTLTYDLILNIREYAQSNFFNIIVPKLSNVEYTYHIPEYYEIYNITSNIVPQELSINTAVSFEEQTITVFPNYNGEAYYIDFKSTFDSYSNIFRLNIEESNYDYPTRTDYNFYLQNKYLTNKEVKYDLSEFFKFYKEEHESQYFIHSFIITEQYDSISYNSNDICHIDNSNIVLTPNYRNIEYKIEIKAQDTGKDGFDENELLVLITNEASPFSIDTVILQKINENTTIDLVEYTEHKLHNELNISFGIDTKQLYDFSLTLTIDVENLDDIDNIVSNIAIQTSYSFNDFSYLIKSVNSFDLIVIRKNDILSNATSNLSNFKDALGSIISGIDIISIDDSNINSVNSMFNFNNIAYLTTSNISIYTDFRQVEYDIIVSIVDINNSYYSKNIIIPVFEKQLLNPSPIDPLFSIDIVGLSNEEYIIDLSEYFVSPNNTTLSYSLCNSPDITSSNKIIGSNLHILPDLRGETYSLYPYSKDTYYDKMDSNQTISINITELYTISQKEIFPIVSNIIETYDENSNLILTISDLSNSSQEINLHNYFKSPIDNVITYEESNNISIPQITIDYEKPNIITITPYYRNSYYSNKYKIVDVGSTDYNYRFYDNCNLILNIIEIRAPNINPTRQRINFVYYEYDKEYDYNLKDIFKTDFYDLDFKLSLENNEFIYINEEFLIFSNISNISASISNIYSNIEVNAFINSNDKFNNYPLNIGIVFPSYISFSNLSNNQYDIDILDYIGTKIPNDVDVNDLRFTTKYVPSSNIYIENFEEYIHCNISGSNIQIYPNLRNSNYILHIVSTECNYNNVIDESILTIYEKPPFYFTQDIIDIDISNKIFSNNSVYTYDLYDYFSNNTTNSNLVFVLDSNNATRGIKTNSYIAELYDNHFIRFNPEFRNHTSNITLTVYLENYQQQSNDFNIEIKELEIPRISNIYDILSYTVSEYCNIDIFSTNIQLYQDERPYHGEYPYFQDLINSIEYISESDQDIITDVIVSFENNILNIYPNFRNRTYDFNLWIKDEDFQNSNQPLTIRVTEPRVFSLPENFEHTLKLGKESIECNLQNLFVNNHPYSNMVFDITCNIDNSNGNITKKQIIELKDNILIINPQYRGTTYDIQINVHVLNYSDYDITCNISITESNYVDLIRINPNYNITTPITSTYNFPLSNIFNIYEFSYHDLYDRHIEFIVDTDEYCDYTIDYSTYNIVFKPIFKDYEHILKIYGSNTINGTLTQEATVNVSNIYSITINHSQNSNFPLDSSDDYPLKINVSNYFELQDTSRRDDLVYTVGFWSLCNIDNVSYNIDTDLGYSNINITNNSFSSSNQYVAIIAGYFINEPNIIRSVNLNITEN